MNKPRRKILEEILAKLEDVKCDEEEAFENMPESIQYSERGERIEENVQCLEDALDNIRAVVEEG